MRYFKKIETMSTKGNYTPLHYLISTKNNDEVINHLEQIHGNIPTEKLILIDWLFSKEYTTEQIESKINLILGI